jgi:hypothetical protein
MGDNDLPSPILIYRLLTQFLMLAPGSPLLFSASIQSSDVFSEYYHYYWTIIDTSYVQYPDIGSGSTVTVDHSFHREVQIVDRSTGYEKHHHHHSRRLLILGTVDTVHIPSS